MNVLRYLQISFFIEGLIIQFLCLKVNSTLSWCLFEMTNKELVIIKCMGTPGEVDNCNGYHSVNPPYI